MEVGLLPEGPTSGPSGSTKGLYGWKAVTGGYVLSEELVIWGLCPVLADKHGSVGHGLLRLVSVILKADTFQSFTLHVP